MENNKKYKIISRMLIAVIILSIITIIGVYFYNKKKTENDTKNFINYVNKNLNIIDYNKTYYTINYNSKKILTKTIIDDKTNSNIQLTINKNKEITGELKLLGENKYGSEGASYLTSTYTNNKFNCELISNDGYNARCDLLKKYSEEYKKEINELLDKNKTKLKYINPKK